jgi:hypothetical protein
MFALESNELRVRDPLISGEESGRESARGVGTSELAGFRGRQEKLFSRGRMHEEVIDGFVRCDLGG